MHRETPVSFHPFSHASTMDVLHAIAFHHGCKELTVPQRHIREATLAIGKWCKEITWLEDPRERSAMLSHGMREVPAYLICLHDGGLTERTWFIAAVMDVRADTRHAQGRTLRIQHAPLQSVRPGEFVVARMLPLPPTMPATAEVLIDRKSTPRPRQSQI